MVEFRSTKKDDLCIEHTFCRKKCLSKKMFCVAATRFQKQKLNDEKNRLVNKK
jgi:hypothetical protein